jgi:hypothetical protein
MWSFWFFFSSKATGFIRGRNDAYNAAPGAALILWRALPRNANWKVRLKMGCIYAAFLHFGLMAANMKFMPRWMVEELSRPENQIKVQHGVPEVDGLV